MRSADRWLTAGVCGLLALAVWVVFGQTVHHQFVNYDDDKFVCENSVITHGLSLKRVIWVFTHLVGPDQWLPVTSLSQMLDCQFYGLNPAGHHLTNVLLHAATAALLFLVLRNMTGALWPSAVVAALFAVHPLRAESVAWVMGRKDVLSGFFFVLMMGAYVRYARRPFAWGLYLLVLLLYALALLSKTLLVTVPFVLLLLDYWPLNRFTRTASANPATPGVGLFARRSTLLRLVLEKLPLLALSGAAVAATLAVKKDLAVSVPLGVRVSNALVSYAAYLGQMIHPKGLTVLYSYPTEGPPPAEIALAVVVLVAISLGAFFWRRNHSFLVAGWFWYLILLAPVIGLVRPRADRYTYLPQIGLYMLAAWGVATVSAGWRWRRWALGAGAATILASLMVATHAQTKHWRDSISLWSRALACTPQNHIAHNNLADALLARGQANEALQHYQQALQLRPDFAEAHYNAGVILASQGKLNEAIQHYERALQLKPDYADAHNNLGAALATQGKLDAAIQHYERALQLKPDFADAHNNLGNALAAQGNLEAAIPHFARALQLNPDQAAAHANLADALAVQGKLDAAVSHYERALQLNPDSAEAHSNLGNALVSQGKLDEAIRHFERTLQLKPQIAEARYNLGLALTARGQPGKAIQHFQQALNLATAQNNASLAEAARAQLKTRDSSSPQLKTP